MASWMADAISLLIWGGSGCRHEGGGATNIHDDGYGDHSETPEAGFDGDRMRRSTASLMIQMQVSSRRSVSEWAETLSTPKTVTRAGTKSRAEWAASERMPRLPEVCVSRGDPCHTPVSGDPDLWDRSGGCRRNRPPHIGRNERGWSRSPSRPAGLRSCETLNRLRSSA